MQQTPTVFGELDHYSSEPFISTFVWLCYK